MTTETVFQAYTREPLGEITLNTPEQAEAMLERAHSLYRNRSSWLPAYKRIEILEKMVVFMQHDREQLAMTIANEGGKPLVDALVETDRAIDGIKIAIRTLATESGSTIPMGITPSSTNRLAFTHHEPIGVVVAVSAFNHPLNLIVHQVIPAIATGCPVIVKPATSVPYSCLKIAEYAKRAGLEEGWLQVCLSRSNVTEKLVTDARTAFFTFIGSARIGWMLRSKLAPGTRCALEHGGVAPVIVDKNVDIDEIIPVLGKGAFYHAGQVCVSVQRIFVDESIAETFSEKLSAYAQGLKVGDAVLPDTEVGPLIEPSEVNRVEEWVNETKQAGGNVLCGGKRLGDTSYAPTVIYNAPASSKIATSEVFGPVVGVFSYRDREEAIARANELDVSFQASVFSKDIDVAMDTANKLDGSAVMINDHTAFRVDWMPFAGYKHSGHAVGGIPYTMEDMWQQKMIVIKSSGIH